jgi:hypothetical protein
MSVWEIIIIVLIVINVIAFASAIWTSAAKWEKGEKEWEIPLMGLFFIPICVFIALAYPYVLYREHQAKRQLEEEKVLREKDLEEAKKFHLQRFDFRLKGLPFKPSSTEVIFVENEYNERLNDLIRRNLSYIQDCFDKSEYFQSQFIYLPNLVEELSHDEESLEYIAPCSEERRLSKDVKIQEFNLLDYLLVPENRVNITSCFARYRGEENDYSVFECVGFNPEEEIDEKALFRILCGAFDHYPMATGIMYQKTPSKERIGADENFDKESKRLIKEVEERVSKLRKLGISQWALEQLVKPDLKLSRLVITKDYRLLLPDYNDMEIKMEPLVKAVYLLFLAHPEGILFKHLPDYREELTEIYVKLKPYGLTDRAIQSIEDVTNPLLNSINEKCARIRGAFVGQFDDHMARHYYIDGLRGEAKKIAIPRHLVVWE